MTSSRTLPPACCHLCCYSNAIWLIHYAPRHTHAHTPPSRSVRCVARSSYKPILSASFTSLSCLPRAAFLSWTCSYTDSPSQSFSLTQTLLFFHTNSHARSQRTPARSDMALRKNTSLFTGLFILALSWRGMWHLHTIHDVF